MTFEHLFEASNWLPILHNGKLIRIADSLPISNDINDYQIVFESVNSDWEQGVFIQSKGSHFLIDEKEEKLNGFYLWFDKNHLTHNFKLLKKPKQDLNVWNIWRIDNGPMSYGHNGAALYSEDLNNGKKFYCNDGYPDEDFDDIIFTITWR